MKKISNNWDPSALLLVIIMFFIINYLVYYEEYIMSIIKKISMHAY